MKQFNNKEFKKEIIKQFGSVPKLKAHLKSISTNEYGAYTSEVKIYGCKVVYTSNPNCFASYLVRIPMCGMSDSNALDYSSFTKAGIKRLGNYNLKTII